MLYLSQDALSLHLGPLSAPVIALYLSDGREERIHVLCIAASIYPLTFTALSRSARPRICPRPCIHACQPVPCLKNQTASVKTLERSKTYMQHGNVIKFSFTAQKE